MSAFIPPGQKPPPLLPTPCNAFIPPGSAQPSTEPATTQATTPGNLSQAIAQQVNHLNNRDAWRAICKALRDAGVPPGQGLRHSRPCRLGRAQGPTTGCQSRRAALATTGQGAGPRSAPSRRAGQRQLWRTASQTNYRCMSAPRNSTVSARVPVGRPFVKGVSGNPNGRPKVVFEIRDLAQQYGPAAIAKLAEMAGLAPGTPAEAETTRVAAIKELLDRGYGRATQPLSSDVGATPGALHLIAAQLVSAELLAEREQRDRMIDGCAEPKLVDLSMAALPLE